MDTAGQSCGSSRPFDDRGKAEAWLGEAWLKLAASGIREVELVEGEDPIYRMSLEPE